MLMKVRNWFGTVAGLGAAMMLLTTVTAYSTENASTPAANYQPTALITGGNRGIGLEYVRQYAAKGWKVIATCRNPQEATELQALAKANPAILIEKMDVTDLEQIDAVAAKYKDQPIDVVANNAGYSGGGTIQSFGKKMDWAAFDLVMRTNVIGPLKVAEAFLPNLVASQQKKLVNVSSSEGSISGVNAPRLYFYRSSKAALNMEMRNLSFALKGKGITVALINPGPVDTDMMKGLPKSMLRSKEDAVKDLIRITDQMNPDNTGTFWNYDGQVLPW
jgi:NAD(P)-dependent dehydrogenase (short-subunit alcohol dehydrogenase family)